MKTVTGKITRSSPIAISKAASILSKFVSSDTGASQAVNAYLQRATAAFDELARLHSKSDRRKQKKETSVPSQRVELLQHGLAAADNVRKNERKDKRIVNEMKGERIEDETKRKEEEKKKKKGEVEESEGEAVVDKIKEGEEEETGKEKKKKRKSKGIEEEEERKDDRSEERQRNKKKRRKDDN